MSLDYDYSMYVMLINIIDNDNIMIDDDDDDDEKYMQGDDIHIIDDDNNYLIKSLKYFCKLNQYHDENQIFQLLSYILYLPNEIRDYTKEDYWIQCSVPNCDLFQDCLCTLRILHILKIYQSILKSKYWSKIPILPFVTFDKNLIHYDHQQIINDFNHIMTYHQNRRELYKKNMIFLFEFIENEIDSKCVGNDGNFNGHLCYSFERHCRSKPKENSMKLFYSPQTSEDLLIELDIQSELDRFHVYFLHSLCKYSDHLLNDNNKNNEFQQRIAAIINYNTERIRLRGRTANSDDINYNTDISENTNSIYYYSDNNYSSDVSSTTDMDEPMMEITGIDPINKQTLTATNDQQQQPQQQPYIEALNKFHFQSIPEIEQSLFHIQPRFDNIKEEVLHNSLEQLTISDWNEVLRKSKKQEKDWQKKRTLHNKTNYDSKATLKQIMTINYTQIMINYSMN